MHTVAIMTATTIAPAAEYRWNPRLWGILVVLCGALFLDALDVSMVGVALPSIRADLGLSTSSLQWVVSGVCTGLRRAAAPRRGRRRSARAPPGLPGGPPPPRGGPAARRPLPQRRPVPS